MSVQQASAMSVQQASAMSVQQASAMSVPKASAMSVQQASAMSVPKASAMSVQQASAMSVPKASAMSVQQASAISVQKASATSVLKNSDHQQLTLAELLDTEFLICSQCSQVFCNPTLLPCLHAFCGPCVAALPGQEVANAGNHKLVQRQCPLCQAVVTMPTDPPLPPVTFLQSLCQLRHFKHGSPGQRLCSYCNYDGRKESATSLCLDCSDDLCEPCALAHRKTRVTREHVVAPYDQICKGLYDHDIRASQEAKCPQHKKNLVFFCCDCMRPACKTCEAVTHRGHNLQTTEIALAQLKPEVQSFMLGLRKQVPGLSAYQDFLQSVLSKLINRKVHLTESVNKQAQAIHDLVDKFKDSLLQDIHEAFSKEEAEIQSCSRDISVAKVSLDSNAQFLSHLLAVGSPCEVLQLHPAITARLKQLVNMKPAILSHRLAPTFHHGPTTPQNIRILFGSLDFAKVPLDQAEVKDEEAAPTARLSISNLLPEPLDPPRLLCTLPLKLQGDTKEVWPSGLHVRKDKMVVVDRDNKKVKVFDCTTSPPTLQFQFSGKGEHTLVNPFDAVLLENGVVVVTDTGAEKIKVFDITGRWIGDLSGEFRHPRGIAVNSKGQVVVVDGLLMRLTVHDPDTGKLLQTIHAVSNEGNNVLVDPFYLVVTDNDHMVVTDHAAPNIKVFGTDGQHLATYGTYGTSANKVLKPYGVCVDRYGQLLIADSDNHRIHMLLPDGKFSKFLLTSQHKLSHPVTLAINSNGHLVVGEAFGQIKIFKYL